MFHVLPGNFFVPLASLNKTVFWECICKLFSVMDYQLSPGQALKNPALPKRKDKESHYHRKGKTWKRFYICRKRV